MSADGPFDAREQGFPLRDRLLKAVNDADAWMTFGGVAAAVGLPPDDIERDLKQLVDEKLIRHLAQGARGLYKSAASSTPAPEEPAEPERPGNPGPKSTKRISATQDLSLPNRAATPTPRPIAAERSTEATPMSKTSPRDKMLTALAGGKQLHLAELAKVAGCAEPATSYHLRIMASDGSIERAPPGNRRSPWQLTGTDKSVSRETATPPPPRPARAARRK